jgi:hypothetical protein
MKISAPSCRLLHQIGTSDGLLFHAPAASREHRAGTRAVKPIPVFLNLKEEIGWKAPLQNSNLWQEVV